MKADFVEKTFKDLRVDECNRPRRRKSKIGCLARFASLPVNSDAELDIIVNDNPTLKELEEVSNFVPPPRKIVVADKASPLPEEGQFADAEENGDGKTACSDDGLIDSLQAAEGGQTIETTVQMIEKAVQTEEPEEIVIEQPEEKATLQPAGAEPPMDDNYYLWYTTDSEDSEEWDSFCIHCYAPCTSMQGCSNMDGHVFS